MPHLAATTLTGAALAALLPAGLAHAEARHRPAAAGTVLKLTVTLPQEGRRSISLTCDPPGGAHPAPEAACADLARSGGRFSRPAPAGTVCTMEYRPAEAAATGTWRGTRIRYQETFPNPCVLRARTGGIFRF